MTVKNGAMVRLDQKVDVREERGRINVELERAPGLDLAALMAGITDDNRHAEIGFGGPVGQDVA